MSTANLVPETWMRSGDSAQKLLANTDWRRLARDAFKRLQAADGSSHARSLAFATGLVLLQSIIAMVGLASALGTGPASDVLVRTIRAGTATVPIASQAPSGTKANSNRVRCASKS